METVKSYKYAFHSSKAIESDATTYYDYEALSNMIKLGLLCAASRARAGKVRLAG